MKTAQCPSCGAPVSFRSAASIYAVCEFCRSTLLREGEALKNLGVMAELMEDPSLIRIGTEGTLRGHRFTVIGRIQLKYAGGLWNEWHILIDNARNGWLSEAGGEYVVSVQGPVEKALPAFAALTPEMVVTISGRPFTVTDLETARCIGGQGELPFRVAAGYDVDTADLRGDGRFVTIDYSEQPPLVFIGHPVTFDELKLGNLRDATIGVPTPDIKALELKCPECGAPLSVHSGAIESIACGSCGSVIGIDNKKVELLAKATRAVRYVPWLSLGSKGKLRGLAWEAIGFLRRTAKSGGESFTWSEYLLFDNQQGFAWLTEYQGHWNYVRTLSHPPAVARGQKEFKRLRDRFRLFNSGKAEVTYVLGEFYWRVAVGEECVVEDYVSPPLMLSREVTGKEVSWSQGEYLEPEEVRTAFGIKTPPPRRQGVFANQPNPLEARHRTLVWLFILLALAATLVQFLFIVLSPGQVVLSESLLLSPSAAETTLTTPEFALPRGARALDITHRTNIDGNWVDLTTNLVEKTTGEARVGPQTISYYQGIDDGEQWSEGSREDTISFGQIPPGDYYLAVEYELGTDRRDPVSDTVVVKRNPVAWSNYWLLMLFLLAFPLISGWRRKHFETRRWAQSDIAGTGGDDDEDD